MTRDVERAVANCGTAAGKIKFILAVIMLANEHRFVPAFAALAEQGADWSAFHTCACAGAVVSDRLMELRLLSLGHSCSRQPTGLLSFV